MNSMVQKTVLNESKKILRMEAALIKAVLFFSIYIPLYAIGLLTISPNDVRFWLLSAFLIVTGSMKFYRWLRRDDQNYEQKRLELERMLLDNQEKEIELMERKQKIKI